MLSAQVLDAVNQLKGTIECNNNLLTEKIHFLQQEV